MPQATPSLSASLYSLEELLQELAEDVRDRYYLRKYIELTTATAEPRLKALVTLVSRPAPRSIPVCTILALEIEKAVKKHDKYPNVKTLMARLTERCPELSWRISIQLIESKTPFPIESSILREPSNSKA